MCLSRGWGIACLAVTVGLVLAACSGGGSPRGSTGALTSAANFDIGSLELHDDAQSGMADRAAVVVAADRYSEPSWAIQHVLTNVTTMRSGLAAAGFTSSTITEVSGDSVHHEAIKAAITEAADRITAANGLLVIYHTGHGFVDANGTPAYFTRYTREQVAGGFAPVISRTELAQWVATAVAHARARGVTITPVLLADACRTRVMGPSPRATLQRLDLWEVHGTREGRFAEAPDGRQASPFTTALSESLIGLAALGQDVTLGRIYGEVERRMQVATAGRQAPELIAPNGQADPMILRPSQNAVVVSVFDAGSGTAIPGSEIRIDARPPQAIGGSAAVAMAPGRHAVTVSARGYLRRTAEIDVRDAAGQRLEVRLIPEVVIVRGRVSASLPMEVVARGAPGVEHAGVHASRVVSGRDGYFELRMPRVAAGTEVVVASGGEILTRVGLPTAADRYRFESIDDASGTVDGIRVIDLGTVMVPVDLGDGTTARLASIAVDDAARGAAEWVTDVDERDVPEFTNQIDLNEWDQAMGQLQNGRPDIALALLRGLQGRGDATALSQWQAVAQIHYLRGLAVTSQNHRTQAATLGEDAFAIEVRRDVVARALRSAWESASRGDTAATFAALGVADDPVIFRSEHISRRTRLTWQRQRIATIARFCQTAGAGQRWPEVLDALQVLPRSVDDSEDLVDELAPLALARALTGGIDAGVERDDWAMLDHAVAAWNWLGQAYPDAVKYDEEIEALLVTAHQERIPLATRERFTTAQGHFAAGNLTAAHDRYLVSLEGANTHYRSLIMAQLRHLRPQLYNRHLNAGLQSEAEGEWQQAAQSYRFARQYSDRAGYHFNRLVEARRGQVDLSQVESSYQRYFAEEDAAIAVARREGVPQRWAAYLSEFPLGVAVEEARTAITAYFAEVVEPLRVTERGQLTSSDRVYTGRGYSDVYRLPVIAGQSIIVDLRSRTYDPYLVVTVPGVGTLSNDDYNGSRRHSQIETTAQENGTVTITATSYATGATGSYTLDYRRGPSRVAPEALMLRAQSGAPSATEAVVSEGLQLNHILPVDLNDGAPVRDDGRLQRSYQITLTAGQRYQVALFEASVDMYLSIVLPNGQVLSDDDWLNTTQSLVVVPAAVTGTYRIQARTFSEDGRGSAKLLVTPISNRAGALAAWGEQQVRLGSQSLNILGVPVAEYAWQTQAGERVAIDFRTDDFDGKLEVMQPDGSWLINDDYNGDRRHSRVEIDQTQAGTYLIWAMPFGSGSGGSGRLSVSRR